MFVCARVGWEQLSHREYSIVLIRRTEVVVSGSSRASREWFQRNQDKLSIVCFTMLLTFTMSCSQ